MNPDTTILQRQVHPQFIPEGKLSSQAFIPFPKDEGTPSVYDGDLITPQDSHRHYTEILKLESDSVWGVSSGEVNSAGLTCRSDALEDSPAHALIDFSTHPAKSFRKLAKKLKEKALARGCLYLPAS